MRSLTGPKFTAEMICLFLLFFSSLLIPLTTKAQTGAITGRVVTEDGEGLPNVMISLAAVSRESRLPQTISSRNQTSSDEDGNFKFTGLAEGSFVINVGIARSYIRKPLPVNETQVPVYYRPGDNVTITMVKGGVITGRVTNIAGEPLIGAQVSVEMVRDASGRPVRTSGGGRSRHTDDRGVYRHYGLTPGSYIVFTRTNAAGSFPTPYDGEVPTYHPSSTRDTTAEVTVTSGSEANGIDIRHRGDRGRVISGVVSAATVAEPAPLVSVTLYDARAETMTGSEYIPPGGARGFAFQGLTDGEYVLTARTSNQENNLASAPRRISLSGRDATGLDLKLFPLGSISGSIVVESLPDACGEKGKIRLEEFFTNATRDDLRKDDLAFLPGRAISSRRANEKGEFTIDYLDPGHYRIGTRLTGENLYVKTITSPANAPTRRGAAPALNNVSRNGLALKQGEKLSGVTVSVTEGAASLRGKVVPEKEGLRLPARMIVHLAPAEPASADDVLRYAEAVAGRNGAFEFKNIAPGKYRLLAHAMPDDAPSGNFTAPIAWDAGERAKLRKEAEAMKIEVELKPCQRVSDQVVKHR